MLNTAYICRHSLRREERSAEPRLLMSPPPPPPPPPSTPLSSGGTKPRSSRLSLSRPAQNRRSGSVPAVDQSPLQQQEAPFQLQEAPLQQQQEAPASLPDDDFQVSVCVYLRILDVLVRRSLVPTVEFFML